eukprot:PhF_6_TR13307/c0_g1_i1/m.21085/K00784/rnz; ribonuclease Z
MTSPPVTPTIATVIPSGVKQWKFPPQAGGFTMFGYSRAADATGYSIPELGIHLDAGRLVHPSRPDHVFLSHSHTDHAHYLTHMVSRRKPPSMYVPGPTVEFVENYLLHAQQLTNHGYFTPDQPYETNHVCVPVQPGEVLQLKIKNIDFCITVVKCVHSIPSVGFIFRQQKSKLKDEYQSLGGKQIAELRKAGTEVSALVTTPLFAFMGDTTTDVFRECPELLTVPLIIIECSFISDDEAENAKRTGHTLWPGDLELIVRANPAITFVLTHFSHRYKAHEILAFFRQ